MAEEKNRNVSEKVKKLAAAMQEKSAMQAYKLVIVKDSQPDIFDSKFGGIPYWNPAKEYPVDSSGKKLMLLAQINFTAAKLEDDRLPEQGMLQFFISSDDDVYGMDFDEPDSQKNFRVVYHETIDFSITKEQIMALDVPISTATDTEYSPVFKEAAVRFEKTVAYMGTEVAGFEERFKSTVKELFNEETGDQSAYNYLEQKDYDYLYDRLYSCGHWILGYPYFTQYDPRESTDYYDTLLFQMDSDGIDKEDYVMWGDCGVANFFINSDALTKKDFSKVLYNWDCC